MLCGTRQCVRALEPVRSHDFHLPIIACPGTDNGNSPVAVPVAENMLNHGNELRSHAGIACVLHLDDYGHNRNIVPTDSAAGLWMPCLRTRTFMPCLLLLGIIAHAFKPKREVWRGRSDLLRSFCSRSGHRPEPIQEFTPFEGMGAAEQGREVRADRITEAFGLHGRRGYW